MCGAKVHSQWCSYLLPRDSWIVGAWLKEKEAHSSLAPTGGVGVRGDVVWPRALILPQVRSDEAERGLFSDGEVM